MPPLTPSAPICHPNRASHAPSASSWPPLGLYHPTQSVIGHWLCSASTGMLAWKLLDLVQGGRLLMLNSGFVSWSFFHFIFVLLSSAHVFFYFTFHSVFLLRPPWARP